MNERFFKFAREASKKSDYTGSSSSPAIGAVAVYKGSIIAEAWNTNKTSPLQARYNIYRYHNPFVPPKNHCETALVQKIRWKFGDNLQWDKVDIYLYREYKDGRLACSRPCPSCEKLLHDVGIRTICHTIDGGYVEEKFQPNKKNNKK